MIDTAERIAAGARARAAMEEFLGPAFDVVTATYMARLEAIVAAEPWNSEKIVKLAQAKKIADAVKQQIVDVIADGQIALADRKQREKIESLSTERKRWALF